MSKLKKLDSGLYLLLHTKSSPKTFKVLGQILKIYKTDDEVLSEFIKELNHVDVRKNFSHGTIYYLLKLANKRLVNAGSLIRSVIDKEGDLDFLINILDMRLSINHDENLEELILEILNDKVYQEMIEEKIELSTININTLVKIVIASKSDDQLNFLHSLIYSDKVNELDVETLRRSVFFISKRSNKTYEEILDELILYYIKDLNMLMSLKEDMLRSRDKEVLLKGNVADIYENLYTSYNGFSNPKSRKIVTEPELVLGNYSEEVLKKFTDSLTGTYINKTAYHSSNLDIMGVMLDINKPRRAEDIFIKSSYKPIDKTKRKKVLSSYQTHGRKFDGRLSTNIYLCLDNEYYELLLNIISAKKIDSLNVEFLYSLITELIIKDEEICQRIIDVLLFRISEESLLIYRYEAFDRVTNHYDYSSKVFNKDKALDFINLLINNPDIRLGDSLDKINDIFEKYKK